MYKKSYHFSSIPSPCFRDNLSVCDGICYFKQVFCLYLDGNRSVLLPLGSALCFEEEGDASPSTPLQTLPDLGVKYVVDLQTVIKRFSKPMRWAMQYRKTYTDQPEH